jgi:hypothetical protein
MGCGMSTEDKEGKARNEEIENQLKRDKMMQRNEIKMLLLGMSPSSRSSTSTGPISTNVLEQGLVSPASRRS